MAIELKATRIIEDVIKIDKDYPLYVHREKENLLKEITEEKTITFSHNSSNYIINQYTGPMIGQLDLKNFISKEEFLKLKKEFLDELNSKFY